MTGMNWNGANHPKDQEQTMTKADIDAAFDRSEQGNDAVGIQ